MMEEFFAERFNDEDVMIKYEECPMKDLTKGKLFIKISRYDERVILKKHNRSPKYCDKIVSTSYAQY